MMIGSPSSHSATAARAMARFLRDVQRLVDAERPAGEADELRRSERLGAAAHPAQPLLHVQRGDVAADRRLGRLGQLDQLLHRRRQASPGRRDRMSRWRSFSCMLLP